MIKPTQGTGKTLPWLFAIFLVSLGLVVGLRGFFADLDEELRLRSANERARLFIGEEIVAGILGIKHDIFQMAATRHAVVFTRIGKDIVAKLTYLENNLEVLKHGGTVRRSLRLNIPEIEEIAQEVVFQPTAEDQQWVMEQIEIGSKLEPINHMTDELGRLLTRRWEALNSEDQRQFFLLEGEISVFLKQVPPYFERLEENANRLFVEGEKRLHALEAEIQAKRAQLERLETALIALVIFLGTAIGYQLLRRLSRALGDAQRFGKEIEHQRTQVATILDTLSDGVYATDLDGRVTFLNAAAANMFGWPENELLGRSAHAATHHVRPNGESYPATECPLQSVLRQGTSLDGEEWFVKRDGQCFPVEFRTNPLSQEGAITGALVSFRDISVRRANEARIRLLETAIQESDQGILITAADANNEGPTIQYVNSGFTQITGYAATEAVGQRSGLLRGADTDPAVTRQLVESLRAGQHFKAEIDYQRKDGTRLAAEIDYSPVHDNQGRPSHFIALLSDVGIRRAAENALRVAHDQALENARLKSEFLANMSHEIRTPMNGVIGMTDLLLDTPLNDEQRDFATLVRDSAHALLTILNDILDFSKIEAGKLDIEMVDFSVLRVVEGVADLLAPKAHEKQLSLMSYVDPVLAAPLRGDSTRLRQILLNLAGNAVKFTLQGGVEITVQPEQAGGDEPHVTRVRFEVRDTGIGISPAGQARLFQSFSQADSSTTRQFGGTGLGLAISKQLVTLMHGEIGVSSAEGQGATFWFVLPLHQASGQTATAVAPRSVPEARQQRVLVVDDQPTDQTILQRYLASWGLRHACVADGYAALDQLRQAAAMNDPYNVVLIDYRMPGLDGLELARAVRAEPQLAGLAGPSGTRLVLLTAHDRRDIMDQALAAGFDTCLSKPVRQSELFDSLAHGATAEEPAAGTPLAAVAPAAGKLREAMENGRLILLVEDNLTNQKVAQVQLQKLGYVPHVVANGQEAVEAFAALPYAAILMDCQMPVMDGFEATSLIRKEELANGRPRLPIIAMTANAMQGDRERCIAAGMDDYLSKPINVDHLRDTLAQWAHPLNPSPATVAATSPVPLAAPGKNSGQAIDFKRLASICGDDQTIFHEMMEIFFDMTPPLLDKLRAAIAHQDAVALRAHAHEAKGAFGNLGIDGMASIARELEQAARAADWQRARALLVDMDEAYPQVRSAIAMSAPTNYWKPC